MGKQPKTGYYEQIKINRDKAEKLKAKEHYTKEIFTGGGFLEKPPAGKQNPEEERDNYITYKLLAQAGYQYRLLPVVNEDFVKNPDALNCFTGYYSDAKHPTTVRQISRSLHNGIKSGYEQGSKEIIFRFIREYKQHDIIKGLRAAINTGNYNDLHRIIIITSQGVINVFTIESLLSKFKKQQRR